MLNLKEDIQKLVNILKLRTFPLGLQFFENAEELDKIDKIKRPTNRRTFCQIAGNARLYGWTIGITKKDLGINTVCPAMLGLYERPSFIRDGSYKQPVWFENIVDSKKYEDSFPVIPSGRFNAVAVGPIFSQRISPDILLIYGDPTQLMLILCGLQWKDYERFTFHFSGESSCADAIAQCFLSKKPALALPCFGERRYGHVQDNEMYLAMPPESLAKAVGGIENLAKNGIRYPIPFYGVLPEVEAEGVYTKYEELFGRFN
jgi:uncharacterized protein (DUF169 family)